MSKKTLSREEAAARAEARRRSRMLARGETYHEEAYEDQDEVAPSATRGGGGGLLSGGFLQRIFPPAPPLPGMPDPMAGFTYDGAFKPLVSSLWLIRRNLFAGVGMGVFWAAAYMATVLYARSAIGTVASLLSFGALVAAGWFGWQRPWLYGLFAAVLGYVLFAGFLTWLAATNPEGVTGIGEMAQYLVTNGVLQTLIGALAGFYGGYLRRRFSDPSLRRPPARKR